MGWWGGKFDKMDKNELIISKFIFILFALCVRGQMDPRCFLTMVNLNRHIQIAMVTCSG